MATLPQVPAHGNSAHDPSSYSDFPPAQRAIRVRCVHPRGAFVEFPLDALDRTIPERFEAMVRQAGSRVAIDAGGRPIGYDALNRSANRVARITLNAAEPGSAPVAILLDHGAALVTTILGVFKAGRCFVPLDPGFPPARLAYMVEDSRTRLILTGARHAGLARRLASGGAVVQSLDDVAAGIPDHDLGLAGSSDDLAWVIYTSGSTGRPKGVMQTHRNVLHVIRSYTNACHLCAEDRLSHLESWGSSMAQWQTFGALLNGATLLPFDLRAEGPGALAGWLAREEITVCNFTPTIYRHVVSTLPEGAAFPHLRVIRLGGEPTYATDVALYRRRFPRSCVLYTEYGATEAMILRQHFIDHDSAVGSGQTPAGYATPGTAVLVLDDAGRRLGSDQAGEIVARTRHLSPGYWGQPGLTEARFPADPDTPGGRLYLTGDLGLLRPDGCLVHLGRKDLQVKIRGHRVEVAEVETALVTAPGIREAAVVAREDPRGTQRLVAYVVPAGPPPSVSALRRALAETVPDYMMPSAFVVLDALPETPNGKLDRQALPAPGRDRPTLDGEFVAPRTPLEKEVAAIWAEVLGLDHVGVGDAFLDLGGDSLLAGQVVMRVLDRFRVLVPTEALFHAGTVADMALTVSHHLATGADPAELERMLDDLRGADRIGPDSGRG